MLTGPHQKRAINASTEEWSTHDPVRRTRGQDPAGSLTRTLFFDFHLSDANMQHRPDRLVENS